MKDNPLRNIYSKDTGELSKTYENYLTTKHWKELRLKVAERDKYTCQKCQGTFLYVFQIHHNTYKRIGNESLKDLSFYCNKCHAIIHNDKKNKKDFNRSYSALINQKMSKMSEEQIEQVLNFMDTLVAKPAKLPPLTCRTCEKENLIDCQRCLNGKNLPFHTGRIRK